MKTSFFLTSLILSCSAFVHAQKVGPDVFLKGNFLEVGIASNGAYGSGADAPLGYHPRPDVGIRRGPLGFVSDPAKDGWLVSAPGTFDYYGDFFMPGTAQEGWDIEINGRRGQAYRRWGPTSLTGGLAGTNTAYTATPTQTEGVWEGSFRGLRIKQTTTQKRNNVYFVTRVVLTNTGTTTLRNIYYSRNVDPEPDVCIGGSYSANKKIVFQPNTLSRNCLVSAVGQVIAQSYIAMGTKDCRAKCFIVKGDYTPDASLSNIYSESGAASDYRYKVGAKNADNACMGLIFKIGDLGPGKTTEIAFAYILKQSDLDSALSETTPKFESKSSVYSPYTTFRVCPGTSFPLKIRNGTAYSWTWSPAIGLSSASVNASGQPNSDSVYITVNGPRRYTATGTNACDTQYLVFDVDTINFSVPPSVATPVIYCQGEAPAPLTAGAALMATLLWSTSPGGVETTVAPTPTTADAGTVRYYVRQRSKDSCFSSYAYIDVIVKPIPPPPVVKDTIYCLADTTGPVTAEGLGIRWYDAPNAGNKYPTAPIPPATGTVYTYYASQTIEGCESDRAALNVRIAEIHASFLPADDSLCGDELTTVDNQSTHTIGGVAADFRSTWTFGDGKESTATTPGISYNKAGIYQLVLRVFNDHGCADSMSRQVFVDSIPSLSFTASDTVICEGETIHFAGQASPGYNGLEWDFGDGDPASYDKMSIDRVFRYQGMKNVSFKARYPVCGTISRQQPVIINATPLVNLGQDTTICPGNAALVLENLHDDPATRSYLWNTGDTGRRLAVRNTGSYWLRVSEQKCRAADSITILKGCYINIPNAFTPGDPDPRNAYFIPRDLHTRSATGFEMQIFNRWGELVFETKSLDGKGWDGTYKGQDQPFGVYVYRIQISFANGIAEKYSGNVTLLR